METCRLSQEDLCPEHSTSTDQVKREGGETEAQLRHFLADGQFGLLYSEPRHGKNSRHAWPGITCQDVFSSLLYSFVLSLL